MQYISAAYYPASLVFYPMESNLGYRPGVSKEVFACLDDEQVNVYRDICSQLVLPAVAKERPEVVGVSIGTQMQLMAGLTFCRMIKEAFPDIHVMVGGNVITRLQEELPKQERFFTEIFDTAIMYEGEHALLWLIEALEAAGARCLGSESHVPRRTTACRESRDPHGEDGGVAVAGFRRLSARQLFRAGAHHSLSRDPRLLLGPLHLLRSWPGLFRSIPRHDGPAGGANR